MTDVKNNYNPWIPPDMRPLPYISATPAELIGFTQCVNFHQARCFSALSQLRQSEAFQHEYTGLLFLVDGCSNSAEFSTEQTGSHTLQQQYNIRLLFKITHSVLTLAHKSQKGDKHRLFY